MHQKQLWAKLEVRSTRSQLRPLRNLGFLRPSKGPAKVLPAFPDLFRYMNILGFINPSGQKQSPKDEGYYQKDNNANQP